MSVDGKGVLSLLMTKPERVEFAITEVHGPERLS